MYSFNNSVCPSLWYSYNSIKVFYDFSSKIDFSDSEQLKLFELKLQKLNPSYCVSEFVRFPRGLWISSTDSSLTEPVLELFRLLAYDKNNVHEFLLNIIKIRTLLLNPNKFLDFRSFERKFGLCWNEPVCGQDLQTKSG